MAKRKRDYQAEYAKRIARNLARGKTVQQARGHAKGDRGKVARRQRGSTVLPLRHTRKYALGAGQQRRAEEFVFLGREEGPVLAAVRAYADAEVARQKRRRPQNRQALLFRFIYQDVKYSDDPDREDAWSTSSYFVYFDWEGFMLDYNQAKARSLDGLIGSVLFGYSG